jgi:hypothetical protein
VSFFFISLSLCFLLLPLRSLGHPWNALFHFSFLFLGQSIGLLGGGISPSQGRYPYKHRINTHKHPCLEWDSNPWSQCPRERRRFTPETARPLWSAFFSIRDKNCAAVFHDSLLIHYTVLVFRFTRSYTTVLTAYFNFSQTWWELLLINEKICGEARPDLLRAWQCA